MTLIKILSDDADRLAAVKDRIQELEIKALHKQMISEAAAARQEAFGSLNKMSSAFGAAASPDQPPPITLEAAVVSYFEKKSGSTSIRTAPPMPRLAIDGPVDEEYYNSTLSPFEVMANFTGANLPTFADVTGQNEVNLYTSLDLAARELGTRHVMSKLGFSPDAEKYDR